MWEAYQEWRHTDKAQETLRSGLIGSPATIRERLREFEATGVDQVILLAQAGRTPHADICASLELFARDVMPVFHAREPEHERWKADVLAGLPDSGWDHRRLGWQALVDLSDLQNAPPVAFDSPAFVIDLGDVVDDVLAGFAVSRTQVFERVGVPRHSRFV